MRLIFLILAALVSAGCTRDNPNSGSKASAGKLNVVATVGMLADTVKIIGGDRVEVVALMGPGTDPHLYKPTAGDVQKLDQADIVIAVGLELEGRMTDIFAKLSGRGKAFLAAGEAIPADRLSISADSHGRPDPHIWFDPELWAILSDAVAAELTKRDPDGKDHFAENLAKFKGLLLELDGWARTEIATIPESRRVLITAHDAFHYFGQRFGLEVRGIQGTSTASEAGAAAIRDLAILIVERDIPAIFVESTVPGNTIEALRQAVASRGKRVTIGGELYSDALGPAGSEGETYAGMFRHNVSTIVNSLK